MTNHARARISDAAKWGLHYGGAFTVSRRLRRSASVIVLRYHSVCETEASPLSYIDPGLSVPLAGFDRQMQYLKRHYTPMSIDDVVEAVVDGRGLPPRAVAVTFDDGYRDNYQFAYPVLQAHGIPGAFYITAGCVNMGQPLWTSRLRFYFMSTRQTSVPLEHPRPTVLDLRTPAARHASFAQAIAMIKSAGKERGGAMFRDIEARLAVTDLTALQNTMMTWGEIETMSRGGMTIGAHTLTHPNLPGLPADEADAEIAGSRSMIEEKVNAPVLHFAYPNGRGVSHYNEPVRELVRKAGFLSSVTSVEGPVYPNDDPFALQRVGVYRKHAAIHKFALDIERMRLLGRRA